MNVRALYTGFKVAEVPSFEDLRVYGTGRLRTIPDGWRVLKAIVREWFTQHRRIVSQPGVPQNRGVQVSRLSKLEQHEG